VYDPGVAGDTAERVRVSVPSGQRFWFPPPPGRLSWTVPFAIGVSSSHVEATQLELAGAVVLAATRLTVVKSRGIVTFALSTWSAVEPFVRTRV
jgi:hypothetical protein